MVNESTICHAIIFICANVLNIHLKLPNVLAAKKEKKTIHTIKGRPKLQNKKERPILIGNLGFGSIEIFKNQIESIVLARYAQCPNICNNKNCMLFFFVLSTIGEHVLFARTLPISTHLSLMAV